MSTSHCFLQKHLKDLMISGIRLPLNETGKKYLDAYDHYTQHHKISSSIVPSWGDVFELHILSDSQVEYQILNIQILKNIRRLCEGYGSVHS